MPYTARRTNAICECFEESLQRERLDHMLVISVLQLIRILKEYVSCFNQARPHPGIRQRIPEPIVSPSWAPKAGRVIAFPVSNRLNDDYRRAAAQASVGQKSGRMKGVASTPTGCQVAGALVPHGLAHA
jgi:putative transposase